MNIKNEVLKIIDQQFQEERPPLPENQPPSRNEHSEILNPSSILDWRNSATNREPPGKVAHLPPEIRLQVCEWIAEGVNLQQIADQLATLGFPGFTHQNISNWKARGYRRWLGAQQHRVSANDPCPITTAIHNVFQLADSLYPPHPSIAHEVAALTEQLLDSAASGSPTTPGNQPKIHTCTNPSIHSSINPTPVSGGDFSANVELAKAKLLGHLALAGDLALALECGELR